MSSFWGGGPEQDSLINYACIIIIACLMFSRTNFIATDNFSRAALCGWGYKLVPRHGAEKRLKGHSRGAARGS